MPALYPHKVHGWMITYTLYFLDGSSRAKHRYTKDRKKALLIEQDAERLELLSMKHRLSNEEALYFLHLKLIDKDELQRIVKEELPLIDPQTVTWQLLGDVYKKHLKTAGTELTQKMYAYYLPFINAYFKDIAPLTVDTEKIKDFIIHCRDQKKSDATIVKYLQALRVMFDFLVDKKLLKTNPARAVKAPSVTEERIPRILYPAEFKKFIEGVKEYKHLLYGYFPEILLTYIYTGMRRSELLNLKTSRISFEQHYFDVITNNEIKRGRRIDMHPVMIPLFKTVLRKNEEFRKINKYKRELNTEHFFGGMDTPLVRPDVMTRTFERFIKSIGLPEGVTLHTLRHTFITYLLKHLLQQGYDIKTAMKYTGHKKLSTIARYLHTIPSDTPAIGALQFPVPLLETDEKKKGKPK